MFNTATLDLIKRWEGKYLHAYRDPVGVLTIGYGHTSAAGLPYVYDGNTITDKEADRILNADLAKVEAQVNGLVHVKVNENQRGAIGSFTFNLGPHALQVSTLLRRLNAGDYNIANEFGKWVYAGGTVLPGLVKRRADEARLWGLAC